MGLASCLWNNVYLDARSSLFLWYLAGLIYGGGLGSLSRNVIAGVVIGCGIAILIQTYILMDAIKDT
jgi:hypothetical protein